MYASELPRVVLDCNVYTGASTTGSGPTDNTAAIQEFLNTASASNPIHLIMDGGTLHTGLHISPNGHTRISGLNWDCGFFIKAGSNANSFDTGPLPATAPSTSGSNVTFDNFQINGNRGNGTNGNCTSGDPRIGTDAGWKMNVWFNNLNSILFDHMFLWDAPTYGADFINCYDVVFSHCTVWNPNTTVTLNNDGLHFDGPGGICRVHHCRIANNFSDDGVAINSPEGYLNGVLDQFIVSDNTFEGCLHALRVYGAIDDQVGVVTFNNNSGACSENVVLIGLFNGPASPDINGRYVDIYNNKFSVNQRWLEIDGGCGFIRLNNNMWLNPPGGAFVYIQGVLARHISALIMNGNSCYMEANNFGTAPPLFLNPFGAATTIDYMSVGGYHILKKQGIVNTSPTPYCLKFNSGTSIGRLHISDLDLNQITAPMDNMTSVTTLTGSGIYPQKGQATLVAGTVTVANIYVRTGAIIQLSYATLGGTPSNLSVGTITDKTSFVINSSSSADTSVVNWSIIG
jgi:hypothetical protein